MTITQTFTQTDSSTFFHLDSKDGKKLKEEISSVELSKISIEKDSLVKQKMVDFILKYMNLKTLQNSKRTKNTWSSYSSTGIVGVIEKIFSYLDDNPNHTVLDFYYQIGLNTSAQTLSGFSVGVFPPNSNTSGKTPIQVIFEQRMDWLDNELLRLLNETSAKDSLFIFMPEFDLNTELLPQTMKSEGKLLILSPEIFQHEQGKAVFFSNNIEVTEIKKEEIKKILSDKYGDSSTQLYDKDDNYKRVAVVRVNYPETGESWIGILPHLKSFSRLKDMDRIQEQAHLVNLIKNCYASENVAMLGDWNFPMNPAPGTLGLSQKVLSNLPFQIRESWTSWGVRMLKGLVGIDNDFDYLSKGFYVPKFNPEEIPYKERTDSIENNSQCWKKSGKRQHLTDMIATNFGIPWFNQPELLINPNAIDVPLIPSVGKYSYMSDHPQVSLPVETETGITNLVAFNVLANNSIGTNPFNHEPTEEFMEEYRQDLGELFQTLHHSIRYSEIVQVADN